MFSSVGLLIVTRVLSEANTARTTSVVGRRQRPRFTEFRVFHHLSRQRNQLQCATAVHMHSGCEPLRRPPILDPATDSGQR